MTADKKRLMTLLCEAHNISCDAKLFNDATYAQQLGKEAEHLISNGVTFAKNTNVPSWIPVTERLPNKDGSYLIRTKSGAVFTAKFYSEKTFPPTRYRPTEYKRTAQWSGNRKVTEWMPLPK